MHVTYDLNRCHALKGPPMGGACLYLFFVSFLFRFFTQHTVRSIHQHGRHDAETLMKFASTFSQLCAIITLMECNGVHTSLRIWVLVSLD